MIDPSSGAGYIIELSDADRRVLQDMIFKGEAPTRAILRANIILASDRNNKKHMALSEITETFHTTPTTVQNVRTSYANNGSEATIARKKRDSQQMKRGPNSKGCTQ